MSLEAIALGALAVALLGVGYFLTFRVDRALALQRRYAEAVSWRPPSEDPEYYEGTRDSRESTLQIGGVILLLVGGCLLAVAGYAAVFVESFPR